MYKTLAFDDTREREAERQDRISEDKYQLK